MNTEQRIGRLESLLQRVKRNAVLPRSVATFAVGSEFAEIDESDIEIEDDISLSEPAVTEPLESAASDVDLASSVPDRPAMGEPQPPAEQEDEPPRSSPRFKPVATSMDEALADIDLPPQTPPPESGDQVAAVHPPQAPPPPTAAPEQSSGLQLEHDEELDLSGTSGAQVVAEGYAPTVDLEEPFDGELELDDAPPPSVPERGPVRPEELAEPADHDIASLPPPISSRAAEADVAPASSSRASTELAASAHGVQVVGNLDQGEAVPPQAHARPESSGAAEPVSYVNAARSFRPSSFMELLDASLGLGSGEP